jgi:hypothetical protein
MALIAYAPFPFSGLLTHRGRTFWVHGWTDDYVELSIDSSIASPQDLRQVAYDVGIQLGRAHPKEVAGEDFPDGLEDPASPRAQGARIAEHRQAAEPRSKPGWPSEAGIFATIPLIRLRVVT